MRISQTLLVTGGCGFIGSNFIRFVLAHRPDWAVVNLDSLTYCGNPQNLADLEADPRYRFVHASINDREWVDRLMHDCHAVVHFAAHSHVDRSILDPSLFMQTNAIGTQTLLESARACGNKRFIHISTDEVYGSLPLDKPEMKFTEDSPLLPNSPYAASKAAADMIVRSYHQTFGLDTIITRCPNNFGPYQFPEKIIPLFVTNLLTNEKVPLYGDGLHIRDWIHVDDNCQAILTLLEKGTAGQVYNIGADSEQSNLALTRTILKIMGKGDDMIQHVTDRPGHDRRYAVDASKIKKQLGWHATRSSWPQALETTVQWYTQNKNWWQRIKPKPPQA